MVSPAPPSDPQGRVRTLEREGKDRGKGRARIGESAQLCTGWIS